MRELARFEREAKMRASLTHPNIGAIYGPEKSGDTRALVLGSVRSSHRLPAEVLENRNTTVIEASVLDLTDQEMVAHVKDCDAVVSCLGRVMDFKGMFGEPKKLCTDATRRSCDAIEKTGSPAPTRFILMNTVAVQNPAERSPYDINESPTTGILTGRPTARSNVAHFMIELIENSGLWKTWKFRMPVVTNATEKIQ